MTLPLMIIGAGGHAAVLADALLAAGHKLLGFTDTDVALQGRRLCALPVLGDDRVLEDYTPQTLALVCGLGGVGDADALAARSRLQQRLAARGWTFAAVRHPSAVVSSFAHLGIATQLLAGCVVQPGADVGEGSIVNTAAVVEHDAQVGAWCHVAPRALLCGNVRLGERCHVGAGAVVRQGLSLGPDTVIGAGAVVVHDFAGAGLLVGVPARRVERMT